MGLPVGQIMAEVEEMLGRDEAGIEDAVDCEDLLGDSRLNLELMIPVPSYTVTASVLRFFLRANHLKTFLSWNKCYLKQFSANKFSKAFFSANNV